MSRLEPQRRTTAFVIDDAVFGPLRTWGPDGKGPWLWESLELLDTIQGRADLTYSAGPDGPGVAHRAQLNAVLLCLDALTEAAMPLIAEELARYAGDFRIDHRWTDLEWRGGHLTGREGEFRLDYSVRIWPDWLIMVEFEQSRPASARIEH